MAPADARERLLASALEYLATRGISDLSLRQLAEALGTSHRMLIYHFGSKEGLLLEVVRAVENAQRALWTELLADPELAPADRPGQLWQRVSAPEMHPYARLFFELYGQALQGREPAVSLLAGDIEAWMQPGMPDFALAGYPPEQARAVARLGVAVTRGLLLDLLATGDRDAVDDAMRLFLSWYRDGGQQG